ncbi:response regulator [Ectothiorhodospiraceae bacterium BW-2]|nr:response regulator [Ectothiorhodospiraceae bacterium BW-2]
MDKSSSTLRTDSNSLNPTAVDERISRLTGEFIDPKLEQQYQQLYWRERALQIRMVLIVSTLAYLLATWQNHIDLGNSEYFGWIMLSRILLFSFFMLSIIATFNNYSHTLRFQLLIFVTEIVTGITEAVETYAYHAAPDFENNLLSAPFLFFIILIYYAFIHIRWYLTTLASLIGGTILLGVYVVIVEGNLETIIRHPVMLLGVIAIGGGVIRSMNRLQRHSWLQGKKLANEVNERRRAEQIALEASRAKSEFLAVISHEIRTPLNSIMAMTEVLSEDPRLDNSDNQRQLNILSTAGHHLKDLVEDILDFSRFEANVNRVVNAPFDLRETVKRAIISTQGLAQNKGLELTVDLDSQLPQLLIGDKQRIRQILINLVGNAIKFTEQGTVKVTISRSDSADNQIQICVSDTGIGIPPQELERIFDPFQQVDSSVTRKYQGVGLGLTICRNLVEQMQGTIYAQNNANGGALFTVTLPLAVATYPPDAKHPAPPQNKPELLSPANAINILVIEDSELNRQVIAEYLKHTRCKVIFAHNGREGVESYQKNLFDIVLMDLHMPDIDGISTTYAIRQLEQQRHLNRTPIVIVSADSQQEAIERAQHCDIDDFIVKPISRAELFHALNQFTGNHDTVFATTPNEKEENTLQPLLPRFYQQMAQDLEQMVLAFQQQEYAKLGLLAHVVKGHCQLFGFDELAASAKALQQNCNTTPLPLPQIASSWKDLQQGYQRYLTKRRVSE